MPKQYISIKIENETVFFFIIATVETMYIKQKKSKAKIKVPYLSSNWNKIWR